MTLEQRISTYTPTKYNPYYWWRRFKGRETLHKYTPLYNRILNGDFEVSDYHWWYLWEKELEKQALSKEKSVEKQHEIRGIFGERKRRLLADFEKDEAKIKEELYKAFKIAFRINKEELEEEMLQFDGSLSDFYIHMQNKRNAIQIS